MRAVETGPDVNVRNSLDVLLKFCFSPPFFFGRKAVLIFLVDPEKPEKRQDACDKMSTILDKG